MTIFQSFALDKDFPAAGSVRCTRRTRSEDTNPALWMSQEEEILLQEANDKASRDTAKPNHATWAVN